MANKALSPKQKAFAEHYAACGNATESARLAGYAAPTTQGPRLLENVRLADYIRSLTRGTTDNRIATAEERQSWWTAIMRGDEPCDDFKDRLKASELLGKAQGDFLERHEVTGKNGAPLVPLTLHEFYGQLTSDAESGTP